MSLRDRVLHLVHPALVHFTIAFLVVGPLIESWALLARRDGGARFGGTLTLIGTVALVPTIVAGFVAANSIAVEGAAADALEIHETLGLVLLGVFLILALVRAWGQGRVTGGARVPYAIGLWLGVALTVATAFLGGRLVYAFGVGVAR